MRSLILTTVTVVLTLVYVLFTSAANAEEIVVKFSHVVAEGTPKGQAAIRFKEIVEQRLAGQVKVEIYPNANLMDDEAVIDGLQRNVIQIAAPSLSLLEPYSKSFEVFDLPFLFTSAEAIDRFQQGSTGQQLLGALRGADIDGLCFLHNGMKQISANVPLRLPADAKDKKFRIQPSSVIEAQFNAIGAIPVRAPFIKVFHLLQTGALDGQENTWSNVYSQRIYEVQPYITETNHASLEYMLIVSHTFWTKLPDDVRTNLTAAAKEACAYGNSIARDLNAADRKKIEASRYTQIIALTPQQRQQWMTALKPIWTTFEPAIGKDVIDAAIAANSGS